MRAYDKVSNEIEIISDNGEVLDIIDSGINWEEQTERDYEEFKELERIK